MFINVESGECAGINDDGDDIEMLTCDINENSTKWRINKMID